MPKLRLTMVSTPNERVQPLIDRDTEMEGVDLAFVAAHTAEAQLAGEPDIAEMPLTSYLAAKEQGANLVMVPVFPMRGFFHTRVWCRADAGIEEPRDLAGKRLAVPENQPAGGMWARGTLEHDFGAANLTVIRVPADQRPAAVLARGEVEAALLNQGADDAKPLFPDVMEEAGRYVQQHGFVPANYGYVIRGELYERYPWLAFNLFKAFLEAKAVSKERLPGSMPSALFFGAQYLRQTQRILGEDPFPYGVKANRAMLETLIDYAYEQGLTRQKPRVEELFAPSVRDF